MALNKGELSLEIKVQGRNLDSYSGEGVAEDETVDEDLHLISLNKEIGKRGPEDVKTSGIFSPESRRGSKGQGLNTTVFGANTLIQDVLIPRNGVMLSNERGG
jgi:hypothetical protein